MVPIIQAKMKSSVTIISGEASNYRYPTIEILNVVCERGFEASLPGVTIDPWGNDNDSLEL